MPVDARALAEQFDPAHLPADFYADPYPADHALRQHAPVKRMPDGSWFLTRFEDVVPVYREWKTFSSDKKKEFGPQVRPDAAARASHHPSYLQRSPLHTRLRRAIVGAITQRHIAAMEPGLVTLVDALLADMQEKREVDLIADFAAAIRIGIIGNLLGVPHTERGPLRGWSLPILSALEPVSRRHGRAMAVAQSPRCSTT